MEQRKTAGLPSLEHGNISLIIKVTLSDTQNAGMKNLYMKYTLYAEEITKPLGRNLPNDLIGHTMYKAPTLATAAALATSARALPRRQSEVLCEYYMPNSTDLSTGNFISDNNGICVVNRYEPLFLKREEKKWYNSDVSLETDSIRVWMLSFLVVIR